MTRLTQPCESCGHEHMEYSSTGSFEPEEVIECFVYQTRCMTNNCECPKFK